MQQILDNHLCETIHFLKRGDLGIEELNDCRFLILACPGADLKITLQHCLQTKTRQIAHYNVNGLGQELRNYNPKSKKKNWGIEGFEYFNLF